MPENSPISVVIPTYNRADLLRAALESMLAQSVLPREVVVVDDGSTDHTAEVVGEIADRAAGRIKVIFLQGPHLNRRGDARNRGAAATTTPLVAFLDSDDLWKPQRIERQLQALEKAPEAGFAFCNVQRFDEAGLIGGPCLAPSLDFNGEILGDILEDPRAVPSTLVVRRNTFEQVGRFREMRINEDYELTLRLALHSQASYVPEVLVMMREHSGSTSRALREIPLLDYIQVVGEFLLKHPQLPRQTRARGRRAIANAHFKLARLYKEYGDKAAARRHIKAFVKLRPWDRRAIPAYVRSSFEF
ncbi:MAG TPA: glycosyltransferase family A protein [Chloroflexia bacterium]|nr:glycosyltransferase family A protein [Chloroflexia bacterium]